MAIGRRREAPISAIVKLLDSPSLDARYGACQALSLLGPRSVPAMESLQKCLSEKDLWLRIRAADALAKIGPAAKPAVPKLLEMLVEVDHVNDPRGMQQRYLSFALFDDDGMLRGSLDGVDREALYKAVRAGLKNEDGRARGSLSSVYQNLSPEEIKPLLPAIYQAITEPAPSGEMFADGIRVEGLRVLAMNRIEEGMQACVRYAREQNPWASELRTPELMKILLSYGTNANAVVPELTKLANYFEKEEPDFPEELMKQKAKSVRDTIRAIESSTDTPKLIRINLAEQEAKQPEAKQPEAKQQQENEAGSAAVKRPLKVFILAGQSNMEGHAEIRTFDYIGKDPATAPLLKEMRNPDGTPRVCDKVWMSYLTGPYDGSANGEGLGKLTAGFGARGDQPTKDGGKIGPEFTFGIYMEKALKEPILIIKTAWGGRSLNTEFRPPSAGPYKLPKQIQEQWDKHPQGAHGIPKLEDRKKWQEDKEAASGVFYRMMVQHVKKVLADPARVCPAYDPQQGYELAGFVWLQGFNDLVDGQTYPNGNYDEYSRLLTHFIRDVRKDLSAPKMPFVIGVLGVDGEKNVNFRKAMAAPAAMPEFKGNVVAVDTAPFWDRVIEAALPKQDEYNEIVGTAHTLKAEGTLDTERKWDTFWQPIGKPLPAERNWRYFSVDATETNDKLEQFTDRRFRDITMPTGLENWFLPDFDDSKWTVGKAPIGKGVWNHSGVTLDNYSSTWGKEEFLLMRSTFEVDHLDYDAYRLAILARQGFHVYLNGHKIHTYIWWLDQPKYRSIILDKEQTQYLKKGTNVLAIYANDQYSPASPEHYAALDAWIEGITQSDQEKMELALEEVLSPEDREALKGASNGGYHYFGSAKIFAQMGKAFAEAIHTLLDK
jgi:alpha-galactosidase